MFQHFELVTGERRLEAVGETHEKILLHFTRWRARHDANGAARMHERTLRAAHFDQRNNLRPGKDVIGLMRHFAQSVRIFDRRFQPRCVALTGLEIF
jgi:hypothetical protein